MVSFSNSYNLISMAEKWDPLLGPPELPGLPGPRESQNSRESQVSGRPGHLDPLEPQEL